MKVYQIEKTSPFYKGSGKAVVVFNKLSKIVNIIYKDKFNDENDFIKSIAMICETDFGQELKYGMMSCYEFCSMVEEPRDKNEECLALEYGKEFIVIMEKVNSLLEQS